MAPGWPPPATTAWRGCGQCESRAAASEPANVQIAEPISAGKQQRSTQRSARSALTSDLRVVSPKTLPRRSRMACSGCPPTAAVLQSDSPCTSGGRPSRPDSCAHQRPQPARPGPAGDHQLSPNRTESPACQPAPTELRPTAARRGLLHYGAHRPEAPLPGRSRLISNTPSRRSHYLTN